MKKYLLTALLFSMNSLSAFSAPSLCSHEISPQILSQEKILDTAIAYTIRSVVPDSINSITYSKYNREFYNLINETLVDIFSLPSGGLFCSFLDSTANEEDRLIITKYLFGTNHVTTKKIVERCTPFIREDRLGYKFAMPYLPPGIKNYILIETSSSGKLDSWTNRFNETILFINPQSLNKVQLALLLTHEISIWLDRKNWNDSIWFDFQLSKDLTPVNPEQKCSFLESMNMPYLRTAMATIRALRMERLIMSEISSQCKIEKTKFYNDFFKQSCLNQVKEVIEKEKPLRHVIAAYKGMYFLLPQVATGCYKENQIIEKYDPLRNDLYSFLAAPKGEISTGLNTFMENDLSQSLEKGFSVQFTSTQEDDKLVDICSYMTTPKLGRIINPMNDGPRPRIGGGWL